MAISFSSSAPILSPLGALALLAAILVAGCGTLPREVERAPSTALEASRDSPLVRVAEASLPAPGLSGFRLMPHGLYSLDARIELARRAQHSLDLQYYHLHNDSSGRLLLRHLRDAALRGVRVRLLLDDLYTVGGEELFVGLAAFPNVEVRLFNPFCCGRGSVLGKYAASLADFRRLNRRMHNKLFLADGAIAVAGGRNIADEYFLRGASNNFVDMDAFIVGAVVPRLATIFDSYWNSPQAYPVERIIPARGDREALRKQFDKLVDEGEQMMTLALPPIDILGYGPISEELGAERLGLVWGKAVAFADTPAKVTAATDDIAQSMSVSMNLMDRVIVSNSEVVMVSPYFIPGQANVRAFGELTKRKVKVTIFTNSLGSNDVPLTHAGYARYRVELLRTGVDLYELSSAGVGRNERLMFPGMSLGRLHAKTAVIDRSMVFIGSLNLDPRSASKNTELGIIAESPELAREVLRIIQISKLQNAYRVRLGPDGSSLEWLTMDGEREIVLSTEPETSLFQRLKHFLLSPFVPESQL